MRFERRKEEWIAMIENPGRGKLDDEIVEASFTEWGENERNKREKDGPVLVIQYFVDTQKMY